MRLLEPAAGCQPTNGASRLDGRDIDLPLSDGYENGFDGRPGRFLYAAAILFGRNEPGNFLWQIHSRFAAKAGCRRKLRNLVDSQGFSEIVEIDITGMDDCCMQV